ncbi:MAG: DUF5703 domain-containing protein [Clostridiales bacterium]|jgi:hypothetical protein|nr:DUF5703 domain-containing protein [Clostridiales bacterium]
MDMEYVFDGLMEDARQSIPLGNGDLGVNVWAERDGRLFFLLSKTDSWSENGDLLKLGLASIALAPSPLGSHTRFRLSLAESALSIACGGGVEITFYVDANQPFYRMGVRSPEPVGCRVEIHNCRGGEWVALPWDSGDYEMQGASCADFLCAESRDVPVDCGDGTIGICHRNACSVYGKTMRHQGLDGFCGKDPLKDLAFGFFASAEGCRRCGAAAAPALESVAPRRHWDILMWGFSGYFPDAAGTAIAGTAMAGALGAAEAAIASHGKALRQKYAAKDAFSRHSSRWGAFWANSYIRASGCDEAEACSNGYAYQRYMNRCAGLGAYPVKFNGSIFTMEADPRAQEGAPANYDYRGWGGGYWFQNTRHIYWNMLYCGDYAMMKPFFEMYLGMQPLAEYRTKEYFGHDGFFIPETVTFFGTYLDTNYGTDRKNMHKSKCRNRYIRWYYSGALELCYMMLKYCDYSADWGFWRRAEPFVQGVLAFYDQHFDRLCGTLCLKPISSLETWHDCVNDATNIAGLRAVCQWAREASLRAPLNAPPAAGNAAGNVGGGTDGNAGNGAISDVSASPLQALCDRLISELPSLPLARDGENRPILAPCAIKIEDVRRNTETPELSSVFPYYEIGMFCQPELGRATYHARDVQDTPRGWRQDGIFAALLGLTDEAARIVANAFRTKNADCAFPAFWGPNYDWTPDQDHGCANAVALYHMLVQRDGDKVRLLPAWPEGWDVAFRLPVGAGGWVECEYRNRRVVSLGVEGIARELVACGR